MPQRSTRLKIALVAFVIAVLGAAALVVTHFGETMANFADDTFGGGEFNVADATWQVESNVSADLSNGWVQTDTDNPATLTVSNLPINPAEPAYARYSLRVQQGSPPSGATVTMPTGIQLPGSSQAGSYGMRVVLRTDSTCNASVFTAGGEYVVGGEDAYENMLTAGSDFTLPAPNSYSTPGDARTLCFEFSLPDAAASDALNGTSVSVRWTFTATQN